MATNILFYLTIGILLPVRKRLKTILINVVVQDGELWLIGTGATT
jgi:hypothetical protein